MTKPEMLRLRAAATAIGLLSGAVMMSAGYVGHTKSWTTAGFITIPGGILILAARALARRTEGTDRHPLARADSHRAQRAGVMAAMLLAGGVMVLAGYTASAWGWGLAAALATLGGLVIATAFAVDRRLERPPPRRIRPQSAGDCFARPDIAGVTIASDDTVATNIQGVGSVATIAFAGVMARCTNLARRGDAIVGATTLAAECKRV